MAKKVGYRKPCKPKERVRVGGNIKTGSAKEECKRVIGGTTQSKLV
jgi:hypothetical protein